MKRRLTFRQACLEVVGGLWKMLSHRDRRVISASLASSSTGIYEEELTTPSAEPLISR